MGRVGGWRIGRNERHRVWVRGLLRLFELEAHALFILTPAKRLALLLELDLCFLGRTPLVLSSRFATLDIKVPEGQWISNQGTGRGRANRLFMRAGPHRDECDDEQHGCSDRLARNLERHWLPLRHETAKYA